MGSLLPGPSGLALFASAVFVLNATPGVDFLLTVARTLQGGVRAGLAAALGINAGCVVHALLAAGGLAALLASTPRAFAFIQWGGAGYLAWLGIGLLRRAWAHSEPIAAGLPAAAPVRSRADDLRTGFLTNVLNPKVALFFLAFLPQFVPAASPSHAGSFLLLGAWFVAQSLLFLVAVVLVASRLAKLQGPPALRRALNAAGGLLFVALALRLLAARPAGT
ncbi:MAG: LysE family translocator [Burkholderiales bacterium]|nr:LysE family translocator [Burkholderiales bacterium]